MLIIYIALKGLNYVLSRQPVVGIAFIVDIAMLITVIICYKIETRER